MVIYKKRLKKLSNIFLLCFVFIINSYIYINAETLEIQITSVGQVVDSFNGVDAIYKNDTIWDGSDNTYSCAAFVKKYYNIVYGVVPYNLFYNSVPVVDGMTFERVIMPSVGDIAVQINDVRKINHWAIVKEVKQNTVVLIEQNWKYAVGDNIYSKINREVSMDSMIYYHLVNSENNDIFNEIKKQQISKDKFYEIEEITSESTEVYIAETESTEIDIIESESITADVIENLDKNIENIELKVNEAKKIKGIKFSSSNKTIAKVKKKGKNKGKIKAISEGQAIITSILSNGITVKYNVIVKNNELTLSKEDVTIIIGEKFILKADTLKSYIFKSEDENIAIIDENGLVTGMGTGKTNIVVSTISGEQKSCIVRVK